LKKVNLEDQGGGGKITLRYISTKYTGSPPMVSPPYRGGGV
jgi:hypothetical protein